MNQHDNLAKRIAELEARLGAATQSVGIAVVEVAGDADPPEVEIADFKGITVVVKSAEMLGDKFRLSVNGQYRAGVVPVERATTPTDPELPTNRFGALEPRPLAPSTAFRKNFGHLLRDRDDDEETLQ